MKTKNLVVGAGISGAIIARRIAEEKNEEVYIVDRNNYIGGFCNDYKDDHGLIIQRGGPHIFSTNSDEVWNFLSRFTKWFDYEHKVESYVNGKYYAFPINIDTINRFMGLNLTCDNISTYLDSIKTHPEKILTVKDAIESQIGEKLYKAFFEKYTEKQWGDKPENLPASIVGRIKVRKSNDDRYFTKKYQGIPENGYTEMLSNVLSHKNIHVLLNTSFNDISTKIEYDRLYYSGSIDELYNYKYGKLPYRCVGFKLETFEKNNVLPVAVVNYPDNNKFTRITEFNYFMNKIIPNHTVIAREYPSSEGTPSYPIPLAKNIDIYKKYESLKDDKTVFIGRLGKYRYYSMDDTIEEILKMKI